jgi:hypothetical protein
LTHGGREAAGSGREEDVDEERISSRQTGTQKSSADFGAAVVSDLGIACFAGAKPDVDSIGADWRYKIDE